MTQMDHSMFYKDYSNAFDRKLRFQVWLRYKELVDAEVKALEKLIKKFQVGTPQYETVRHWLNEMYHTQYELDHNQW